MFHLILLTICTCLEYFSFQQTSLCCTSCRNSSLHERSQKELSRTSLKMTAYHDTENFAKMLAVFNRMREYVAFSFCSPASTNSQFFYRANFFCDVVLLTSDQKKEFPAHKAVLASCSSYFHAMFTNFDERHQNRIVLQDIDPIALGLLLDFLYTSQIQVTEGNSQVLQVFVILTSDDYA